MGMLRFAATGSKIAHRAYRFLSITFEYISMSIYTHAIAAAVLVVVIIFVYPYLAVHIGSYTSTYVYIR